MTTTDERRADGIRRVPVEALVEVCSVGGKQPAFEAESADVSGRGIRLRTAYLPEAGSPVVCRFENSGREVIAEGVVAWCQKETRGGEFGVKFTALDARSADTLRDLCGLSGDDGPLATDAPGSNGHGSHRLVPAGTKVKLHIEGLGAPMRARVDDGKAGQLSVGSSLEFLRIGRKLELESIEDGRRHEARIDGLDVSIDPSTGVPRLLVLLKTQGDENTPQPSVVDTSQRRREGGSPERQGRDGRAVAPPPSSSVKSERVESAGTKRKAAADSDDPTDEQIDAMVGGVRRLAGATKRKMTEVTFQLGNRLRPSMVRAFQRVRQMSHRQAEPPRRRTTAAPTASSSVGSDRGLRPQNRHVAADAETPKTPSFLQSPRVRKIGTGVVATGLLATVIAVGMRNPEPNRLESASTSPTKSDQVTALGSPGSTPAMPGALQPGNATSSNNALIAQVPLFGPTQMATLEHAPIPSATPEPATAVAARERAIAKATQAAVAGGVDGSKMSEEPGAESSGSSEEPATKPEDVAPFGHGRMKDPILYRIKLDAPGEALKGTSSGKGFTVMIPGRKALESPKGFVKRDDRFEKINATNSADGVKLSWQFKNDAPPFRVRLRKSAVEILISEDAKSASKK